MLELAGRPGGDDPPGLHVEEDTGVSHSTRPGPGGSVVRVGVLGCGRIARLAHLSALGAMAGVRVAALGDRDPAARAGAARLVPGARVHASMNALLDDPDLDAVVIAVPPPAHREAAVAAFARGLHVYLEKPIAPTLADAESIIAAWRGAGTAGAIGFNLRFNRLYREMRAAIEDGSIGVPVTVRTSWVSRWPDAAAWHVSPAAGGGALLELATHHVDLCRFLLDTEVADASAVTWSVRGSDEGAMLQLQLANGVHVQGQFGYGTIEEDRFEVYGSEGKLVVDRYNSLALERVPVRAEGGLARALRHLTREMGAMRYGMEKRRAPAAEPSYRASLAAFVDAVRSGRAAAPDLEDGLRALRVIDRARAAARRGREAT